MELSVFFLTLAIIATAAAGASWTQQERLLLLENTRALEHFFRRTQQAAQLHNCVVTVGWRRDGGRWCFFSSQPPLRLTLPSPKLRLKTTARASGVRFNGLYHTVTACRFMLQIGASGSEVVISTKGRIRMHFFDEGTVGQA